MSETHRQQAADAVIRAWTDPGINRAYHEMWQERLTNEWPTLARAIRDLVRASVLR